MSKRNNVNNGIRNISKNFTPANKIEENVKMEIAKEQNMKKNKTIFKGK
jgi:hypothetical protein